MSEVTSSSLRTSVTTHFARWFVVVIVFIGAALLAGGGWPSAAGVFVGAATFLLKTRRVRYALRQPLTGAERHPGMLVLAATQAMVGAVCLFVGALIKGDLVLFFSAVFGTWQLAMALFMAVVIRASRRAAKFDETS